MENIGVIGAGTMGCGIAQVAAGNGCSVQLMDVDSGVVQQGIEGVYKRFDRLVEKGKLSRADAQEAKSRIQAAENAPALGQCDLVIEAIVEDVDAKVAAFKSVVQDAKPETVFATNTSSLSVTQMGEQAGIGARLCGMHFFNPVPLMPLVEVVAGKQTPPDLTDNVALLVQSWDKTVVRVNDTPGFVVNRVARPYYLEALRILEERHAGCDSIDLIMKELGGFPMGPFELMDLVGIDVNHTVSSSLYEQSGQAARFRPSDIQARLVEQGRLGRKSGSGFYDYRHNKPELTYRIDVEYEPLTEDIKRAWESFQKRGGWNIKSESGYVFCRMLCAVFNEAALAAEENVASESDIDTAMMLGTNWPKGPLSWAAEYGHDVVGEFLRALSSGAQDDRFVPAKRFQ